METSRKEREPILNPVDRVSEMLFGLFMALTFVGAVSVAGAESAEVRTMFAAALGCNLAWGLVDAVMYLVRTLTDRGRWITLVHSVRAADAATGQRLVAESLPAQTGPLLGAAELDAVRARIAVLAGVPDRPRFQRQDFAAAFAIFLIVVVATFPVVLPFVFFDDVAVAKKVSRYIALAMLFLGGLALGRYAGYGSWKTGLMMAGLGSVLVAAINALGG